MHVRKSLETLAHEEATGTATAPSGSSGDPLRMAGPHRASLPTSTQTGPGGGVAVLTSTATASASFGGAAPAPALGVHSVYGGGVPAAPPSSMLIAGSTPDPRGYAQQLLQQQQQEQAPVVGRPHYLHPPQDTSAIRSTHVVPLMYVVW